MAFEKISWRNSSILTSPRRRIEGAACLLVHFTIGKEGALGVAFLKTGPKRGGFIPLIILCLHQLCATKWHLVAFLEVDEFCDGVLIGFLVQED